MKKKKNKKNKLRRGIYILPNIFTSLNIFCGFYAVIAALEGDFARTAAVIIVAGIFDALDGKIARATHTTSKFGVEYDSLADLISFGMAPALMMYLWALEPLGRIGWLAGFLFMACGALRLARFNTQVGTVDSNFFVGLPIPAAAGMNAVTVMLCERFGLSSQINPALVLVMLYLLSFLMVSSVPYHSFKRPEVFRRVNFNSLVGFLLILIFIAAQHEIALFVIGFVYVLSGPVLAVRHHREIKAADEEIDEEIDGDAAEDGTVSPVKR